MPRFRYSRFKRLNFIVQPAAFIRRTALQEPMLDEDFDFAMDWELWMRLAQHHRFARLDEVLAIDRSQPGRKNAVLVEALRRDERRLGTMYGVRHPWWRPVTDRGFVIRQRLIGGLLVDRVCAADFAFDGYVDSRKLLMKRQVLSRKSRWSEEDKVAS